MTRKTLAMTAALTAAALGVGAAPATAEAVVYDTKNVRSNPPDRPGHEYASLDIPTGYARHRADWHTVTFYETEGAGRTITLDLEPEADTVRKLKAERRALKAQAGDAYQEFAFKVRDKDAKVRVRWVYSWEAEGTEDIEPYVSVILSGGNRLQIVGKVSEKEHVAEIRRHVVRSMAFPS